MRTIPAALVLLTLVTGCAELNPPKVTMAAFEAIDESREGR